MEHGKDKGSSAPKLEVGKEGMPPLFVALACIMKAD